MHSAELPWVQQLWSHVTGNRNRHAISLHNGVIGDNSCNSKVSQARVTLFSDQDVSLDGLRVGTPPSLTTSISHRIDTAMHDP